MTSVLLLYTDIAPLCESHISSVQQNTKRMPAEDNRVKFLAVKIKTARDPLRLTKTQDLQENPGTHRCCQWRGLSWGRWLPPWRLSQRGWCQVRRSESWWKGLSRGKRGWWWEAGVSAGHEGTLVTGGGRRGCWSGCRGTGPGREECCGPVGRSCGCCQFGVLLQLERTRSGCCKCCWCGQALTWAVHLCIKKGKKSRSDLFDLILSNFQ